MSSSSSKSQRLTLKQADTQDRRRRMTQQRQTLTNRIRKQKKSEYLARKRSLTPAATSSSLTLSSPFSLSSVSPAIDTIQPLLKGFCNAPTTDQLQALYDALKATPLVATEDNTLVVLAPEDQTTAHNLLGHLRGPASSPEFLPMVLDILMRLTAIHYTPPFGAPSYYGKAPASWSELISHNTAWLTQLVQLAPQSEAACIILGNLVGGATSESFVRLRKAGLIQSLLSAVHQPAAAWALTNAIRHDTAEYARMYCNDQALSTSLLERLLKEPAVATQAAWMLAALTNREDEVVQYLMHHSTFANTMVECMQQPVSADQVTPLVQALGNIATTNTEGGIPFSDGLITSLPALIPMIGQLLQTPHNQEVVHQAAWLAGCLLHDAGIPNHPSSTVAAPVLIPILFQELRVDTPHSLDNRREIANALWNGLSMPSSEHIQGAFGVTNNGIVLPPWEVVRSSLTTLVNLVGSMDADAVLASLNILVELLHRNNNGTDGRLLAALEEEDATVALEKVCDSPNEEAAELAANLLDNYIYNEREEDHQDIQGGRLPFEPPLQGAGRGMGRGRGTTLPAWMTNGNSAS